MRKNCQNGIRINIAHVPFVDITFTTIRKMLRNITFEKGDALTKILIFPKRALKCRSR